MILYIYKCNNKRFMDSHIQAHRIYVSPPTVAHDDVTSLPELCSIKIPYNGTLSLYAFVRWIMNIDNRNGLKPVYIKYVLSQLVLKVNNSSQISWTEGPFTERKGRLVCIFMGVNRRLLNVNLMIVVSSPWVICFDLPPVQCTQLT